MDATVEAVITAIGEDRRSGSTALLGRGVELLQRIAAGRPALEEAARRLCSAQPAMAGFRTLAALVQSADDPAAAIDRFGRQIARAPAAIARNALGALQLRKGSGPLRLLTFSASQAVEAAILAAAERFEVVVCCAEGRPQMEGRDLARRLAAERVTVEFYTDAAVGTEVASAEAVLVGADAVGAESFINKVGTAGLCAVAHSTGVPAYVLAGREKMLGAEDLAALELRAGPPGEVWPDPPPRVFARNPYFELIPYTHIAALVTDSEVVNMSI